MNEPNFYTMKPLKDNKIKYRIKLIEPNWFRMCCTNSWECMLAKTYTCHHGKRIFWKKQMSYKMSMILLNWWPDLFPRKNISFRDYLEENF